MTSAHIVSCCHITMHFFIGQIKDSDKEQQYYSPFTDKEAVIL